MDSVRLIVCALLMFDKNILQVEAGVFDPMTNIFGVEQNGNTPNKVIDAFLSPFQKNGDPQEPDLNPNEGTTHDNSRAWWNIGSTSSQATTPDYDKIVADRFPGAVSLLEKLKELNKQKEEQQKHNSGFKENSTSKPSDVNHPKITHDKSSGEKTTDKTSKHGVIKSLTKKKFYFQVQPVRPEGENVKRNETVYYEDH